MKYVVREKEFIFKDQRPFPSCHASSVVLLEDGHPYVAWFGGTRESADDVAIWSSSKGVDGWSEPCKIADEEGVPLWNPVLFYARDGRLHLFYKVGATIPNWVTMSITSDDDARTWSAPKPLVEGDIGGRGPVKNKPVYVSNGAIVAPASIETPKAWDAFADISEDGGERWVRSAFVPIDHKAFAGKGAIQPTLWESDLGVHMLLRTTAGHIYRSDSTDGGHNWSQAYPTSLPNNNSGIDLTKLDNGLLALVYNPVRTQRTPLVIRLSDDNGQTWHHEWILEDEPGEYSYPAIISEGNDILITYTWKRERIVYWRISVSR